MIHFHIVTLFPKSIEPYLKSSMIGRAHEKKKIKVSFYDPKDFTRDKYGRVDRRPYGGGPGMVLEPDAILRAVDAAFKKIRRQQGPSLSHEARGALAAKPRGTEVIFFSTDGSVFDEAAAQKL